MAHQKVNVTWCLITLRIALAVISNRKYLEGTGLVFTEKQGSPDRVSGQAHQKVSNILLQMAPPPQFTMTLLHMQNDRCQWASFSFSAWVVCSLLPSCLPCCYALSQYGLSVTLILSLPPSLAQSSPPLCLTPANSGLSFFLSLLLICTLH